MQTSVSVSAMEEEVLKRVMADPARLLDSGKANGGWLGDITRHPHRLLSRMAQRGLLHRVSRGLYVAEPSMAAHPVPVVESLEVLAAAAAERGGTDYYLSWHTALAFHRLIEQDESTAYVAVLSQQRDIFHAGYGIRFIKMVPQRFFGWDEQHLFGRSIRIASIEKALLDSLGRPQLAAPLQIVANALLVAHRGGRLDADRLVDFALRIDSPSLNRRLGLFMEHFGIPGHDRLLHNLGKGYAVSLVPGRLLPNSRRWDVDTKWGVMVDPRILYAAESPK